MAVKAIVIRNMKQPSHGEFAPLSWLLRRILPWVMGVGIFACLGNEGLQATTFSVDVAPGGEPVFSPASVSIQVGDTVEWTWKGDDHSVTSGTPGFPSGLFDSGINDSGHTFSHTFSAPGTFAYYCAPHGECCNMVGSVTVAAATPTPTPSPDTDTDSNSNSLADTDTDPNSLTHPDTDSNSDSLADTDTDINPNSLAHPDTGPDRSSPVAERLYQVGRGNRR